MSPPRATMRLQFHRGFTFDDAATHVPYFAKLGVSHLYASPILTARSGSMHGYDVVDPTRVNPELGGDDAFRRLVAKLRHHEMGLIVDIVPNHMAIGSANTWWMDVLAAGQNSRYANYFDIDWSPPVAHLRGRVLLPILGRPYGDVLEAGEIKLEESEGNGTLVRYFDHILPIAPETIDPDAGRFDATSLQGRERLHALLERQNYRLAWWRSANDEINWRRFFDINELAALRIEDDAVFEAVHATTFRLYADGLIDGVRVDHIDGLSQPEAYCKKLRERLEALRPNRPTDSPHDAPYIVVEKILALNEHLPKTWQVDGTTGYDFMDEIAALLHDSDGERDLRELWRRISGRSETFEPEENAARRQLLQRSFSAQLEQLVQSFVEITQRHLPLRDLSRAALRRALAEILAHFPVYRGYTRVGAASEADLEVLSQALLPAEANCLLNDRWLLKMLGEWLAGVEISRGETSAQNTALARFQQLSAPLCAKAVEDTAFYRYGVLISRNDVGSDPTHFASSPNEFHGRMSARAAALPRSMLATATHDHKRGEDARARLAVLSELGSEWAGILENWVNRSAPYCTMADGLEMPYPGDRAILFQTIISSWPFELSLDNRVGLAGYAKRIAAWQQKALREAKLFTDWSAPNDAYEQAAERLVTFLFSMNSDLLPDIAEIVQRIAPAGAANALAQTLARLTLPGVPDTYQGTDYWDLSMVDPDNRAPVDFTARNRSLDAAPPVDLASDWRDGRIKQQMMSRVFALRKTFPDLFSQGSYCPLEVIGPRRDRALAFSRVLNNIVVIVAFCRLTSPLLRGDGSLSIPAIRWDDTRLKVPLLHCGIFYNILASGERLTIEQDTPLDHFLSRLPVAVLTNCVG
jgi:(1->4)-alpha-D-glucan 1-alpha-D-glucosylmutase